LVAACASCSRIVVEVDVVAERIRNTIKRCSPKIYETFTSGNVSGNQRSRVEVRMCVFSAKKDRDQRNRPIE
jgi:hypothetical protein